MKAALFFTGTGPVLILTSYQSLTDPELVKKLSSKGIHKFIAYEIPEELVKQKYGIHYDIVMNDLHQEDDLRVLDYNGHHAFYNFTFEEMGNPVYHE